MKITASLLRSWFACEDQVKLFQEVFPDGVVASVEAGEKALKAGLNVRWLFSMLFGVLDDSARTRMSESERVLRLAADKKRSVVENLYLAASFPLFETYREAVVAADVAYRTALTEINLEYDAAVRAGGIWAAEAAAWRARESALCSAYDKWQKTLVCARRARDEADEPAMNARKQARAAIECDFLSGYLSVIVDALNQMEK